MPISRFKRVIMLLADGARYDVMHDLIAKGELPNIARYLPTLVKAATSFPSTTGPAYLPYLTGCLPGSCNVPGIRWFDKSLYDTSKSFDRYRSYVGFESFCMANDMPPYIKTIFELVPDSYSIFNPIARGAGKRNLTSISRIWYWYYGHLTDRWKFVDESAFGKLCGVLKKNPKFIFSVFPALDEYSHFAHPHHECVIERYRWFDKAIADLRSELERSSMLEDTAIFIVSDHGLSRTHSHFCLNAFLEEHGLPPFFYPLIASKRGKLSASMVSGNGMAHLYFKNSTGWVGHIHRDDLNRISPGLIDDLVANEAIAIVACRNSEGGADILSKRGIAKVRLNGNDVCYEVLSSDPFGYGAIPRSMSPRECLNLTIDTEYPDAPFQIAHLIQSPRAGDVILSATPGFDLRLKYETPEHKGSHGSLHSSHLHVPILTNVPLPIRPMRTVDIFPTMLDILGAPRPNYLDGEI